MLMSVLAGIATLKIPPFDPENDPESVIDALREQPFANNILPEQARSNKDPKKTYKMPPGVETVKETLLPDGSRKYTTTKWNKDGTATVTQEIVREE